MKLSHSKLSCILSCPMTYYLNYIQGISRKEEKPALWIGSAVHWGIEHNTYDLTEYFKEKGSFKQRDNYTREQLLAESMIYGYLKHKNQIFNEILTDANGEKLNLIEESHELYITAKLNSLMKNIEDHEFVGILDLLLLTDKGFIIIDYKTSTYEPNWDSYLDQIYRYIFLLKSQFPDIPIIKIGIINIRKTNIRQKKNENIDEFLRRMQFEYEVNDEQYVNYHEYTAASLDKNRIDDYINNLSKMADTAQILIDNKSYFINYSAADTAYGKSDYWDIFYNTPDAYLLYKIKDHILNPETGELEEERDCVPIDMEVIKSNSVLNKYELFKKCVDDNKLDLFPDKKEFEKYFEFVDESLLDKYVYTYCNEKK